MRRKRPTSSRQKKEELKIKRAVKRGDKSPPPPKHRDRRKLTRPPNTLAESSKRLQSSFVKPTQNYLDQTKMLASTVPLLRPIPPEAAIFTESYADRPNLDELTCPRRPKWRYDMSKKDVERNEEGLHKKWLEQTDTILEKWRLEVVEPEDDIDQESAEAYSIRSPSSFERNLEVWRQLWRVTEISQIILVLIDSRCPLLHYPPSLASFLSNRKVILVLTKTDITGPLRSNAWVDYLRGTIPGLRVVQVQSYSSKEQGFYHQGRVEYEARIPQTLREQLVDAIRELHTQLLEPPEKEKTNPERLRNWKPPVKRDINWGIAESVHAQQASANHEVDPEEPPFLTIGLVGQPNVGKSSLLNSLFGESRVRASKTPGKTKHYQTLFLTPEIRLVDCPGLVMPNYVPMEMQVLSGVLPISRVSAIPACVHYILQLLPLEEIFKLTHPNATEPPVADNRTWREGMKRAVDKSTFWTAMDVLVAFANKKGWVTAKAGRPDVSRAGNASKISFISELYLVYSNAHCVSLACSSRRSSPLGLLASWYSFIVS
ncbi:P-loop containing nucleoside triphosphate hydrolase protein [Rhodocollybia butyracea]|uniref:Guanine nucleotide-binding protein-like 1 n=1 Tax=Rhodocollybia butyracea TaxID=206335 RepID=A0A9P5PYB8_9AGAR|nr:P-loop containing nucleoside triphosphate hydrolase protein [Rhodocollybia butyracea]